jgi:hypothetical protein
MTRVKAPNMTLIEVPPWGQMDEGLLADLASQQIPLDWRPRQAIKKMTYQKWLDTRIRQISKHLWPLYAPGGSTWQTAAVKHLFDVDFSLLAGLHSRLRLPINGFFGSTVTHSDLFTEEDDDNIGFGLNYARYDPTLVPIVVSQLRDVLRAGYTDKVGTIDLQMKQVFQRPRPWQIAFIQSRSTYQYRWAATADTSSLVSGHCLQGLMGVCSVYAELGALMTDRSIQVLEQFAVDIGDRRVFAGVHYPSDSLSSWYTASALLPHVFKPSRISAVKRFMKNAIEKRSAVFAAIKHSIRSSKNSPYKWMVATIASNLRPRK